MILTLAVAAALWIAAVIWLIDEVVLDYQPDYLEDDHE
jgi:hypothetical protein